MTTATLSHIGTPSEPWGENNLVFIDLAFTDHEPATLTTNEQGKSSRLADLAALQGKPAEWNFGTNSKGKPTVKIHKADEFGGGGKKGGWQPKSVEERAEILAMNGLNAVVTLAAAQMAAGGAEAFPDAARKKSLDFVKAAMRELVGTATGLLKASGTEGPSVTGKGATASSVPDDNVEADTPANGAARPVVNPSGGHSDPQGTPDSEPGTGNAGRLNRDAASTTTSGASNPLDATPDRDGDGTTKPQEPPSADQPEQGGAVSSRHVHEWVDAPTKGFVLCSVCRIGRPRADVEVGA